MIAPRPCAWFMTALLPLVMVIAAAAQDNPSLSVHWPQDRLGEMLRSDGLHPEGVVLSTCNRVELYTLSDDPQDSRRRLGATAFSSRSAITDIGTMRPSPVFR